MGPIGFTTQPAVPSSNANRIANTFIFSLIRSPSLVQSDHLRLRLHLQQVRRSAELGSRRTARSRPIRWCRVSGMKVVSFAIVKDMDPSKVAQRRRTRNCRAVVVRRVLVDQQTLGKSNV